MSHETIVKSNEWYTPKYLFDAMEIIFDLDVASPVDQSFVHVPCGAFITEDSLSKEWFGTIWMNPPFDNAKTKELWIKKFLNHGNGIALMPDRTSANWWQYLAKNVDAVLFLDGRIKFIKPDGTLGDRPANGTTLFAMGNKSVKALKTAEKNGLGKFYYT